VHLGLKPAPQSHPPTKGPLGSRIAQKILLSLALAAAVVAVYYPVHWQPFANYDDADYVTDNFHVKAGLTWETVQWAMSARDAANWHPVTWISHALDTQIFGLNPAGPHDVNVLLHIVNALLLFWVLQRATGCVARSWMVAALFALHPINVESVAWIAERKNLLSMFFFLLTLGAYRWYAQKPREARYLLVAGLFALGLMSKPQVITLPFVLLLWDYWPLERFSFEAKGPALAKEEDKSRSLDSRRSLGMTERGTPAVDGIATTAAIPTRSLSALIWEKVPLLALCVASAVLTLNAQSSGGATSSYGHILRLENALVSYVQYLGKAIWPAHLALFYPYPIKLYPLWQVFGAALVLLAITAGVALARRRRYLTVGWLWFLGTLVPMIGLVQVGTQAMADRYAYLPFVGLFIMLCWLMPELLRPSQKMARTGHPTPMLLRAASGVVLLALALVSRRQVTYWNDHITLWTHALEVTNNNWVAENNLGTALLKMGRPEEAIPHFRAAAALYSDDPNTILNIGTYEQMHGNVAAAIAQYKKAAEMARNPKTKARAYNNLGYAYKDAGNLADARTSFQRAVEVDPEFAGAWISLGLTAQRMGDLPSAIGSYSRALQIHPSDFGYLLLAGALEQSGDQQQANDARQKAALMSNNIAGAQRYADKLLSH
jgi:Flp pilus assembly protein TadD